MLPKKDSQAEPYALEDMISDLQTRRHSLDDHEDAMQDPAELLKQRERDLVLAAELGKALLERNQELTKQADNLAEEYSAKLEVSADRLLSCFAAIRAIRARDERLKCRRRKLLLFYFYLFIRINGNVILRKSQRKSR